MKKTCFILTMLLSLLGTTAVMAQQRSAVEMRRIASEWSGDMKAGGMRLAAMSSDVLKEAKPSGEAFAVYAHETRPGFVVVSTDERMPEVLAMSDCGSFDTADGENEGLMDLLRSYAAAYEKITAGETTAEELFGSTAVAKRKAETQLSKGPLLGGIRFNQKNPYNLKCPYVSGSQAITGCVAVTMATLMKYYAYPAKGMGSHSYTTKTNGIDLSCDFSALTFNWDNIQDTYPPYDYDTEVVVNMTDDTAFMFEGGMEIDESRPNSIKLTKFYNYTHRTLSGGLLLIAESEDGSRRYPAGALTAIADVQPNYGWNYYYLQPALRADVPDGTYRLFATFTEDASNFSYITRYSTGAADIYLTIEKSGQTFACGEYAFACAASEESVNDIATLMAATGIATEADYKDGTTSASAVTMSRALYEYFGFDHDMYYISTQFVPTYMMQKEVKRMVDREIPVVVSGTNEANTSHSYIIDGYDLTGEEPYYHINWGWNGASNGYFLITQMQPSQAGAGGTTKNYSYSYHLRLNFCPENGQDDGLSIICENVTIDRNIVQPGDKINLEATRLTNRNTVSVIEGMMYWYLVDDDDNAYQAGEAFDVANPLNVNKYRTQPLTTTLTVPAGIPDGTYHIELRTKDSDHFYCLEYPVVTLADPAAVEHVTMDAEAPATEYDITGKRATETFPGLRISQGRKVVGK